MPKFAAEPKAWVEHPRTMGDAERRHIEGVLASTGWVLEGPRGAATALNLNPSTLRSRMKRLGIQRPPVNSIG
jgi:transcriptional regulator with GAF, ATPase, and Fis domain